MQRIINKVTGVRYVGEHLYDPLTSVCSITLEFVSKDGSKKQRRIKSAALLFEGKISEGRSIGLLFNDTLIALGMFAGITGNTVDGYNVRLNIGERKIEFPTRTLVGFFKR